MGARCGVEQTSDIGASSNFVTLWNLSEIGTKPLSAKRLKLLLHELGVSTHDGQYVVGQMEYEKRSARHGGGREIAVLASVARVLVVMGLGPVPSAAVNLEGGDQCSLKAPDVFSTDGEPGQFAFSMFMFFMLAAVVWSTFLWRLYKWLKSTWESHEHLCLQVAQLDSYAGEIRVDCDRLPLDTNNMRQSMTELNWKKRK